MYYTRANWKMQEKKYLLPFYIWTDGFFNFTMR